MSTGPAVPPILRSVTVRRPIEGAFRVFTEEFGSWWPLHGYSRAYAERAGEGVTAESVVLEGHVGGRFYEVMSDGTEAGWGEVMAWEPPSRLVLAWNPSPRVVSTEVEVTFTARDDGTTLVEVEHRGWENLGDEAQEVREDYVQGWPIVLERFVEWRETS